MLIYDPEKSKRPQLLVHKDYKGRLPLCYYATGLQEGCLHNMDACLDKQDIVWAHSVRFHNDFHNEQIS
jgi:hypothetical protein